MLSYDGIMIGVLELARIPMFRDYVELMPLDLDMNHDLFKRKKEKLLAKFEEKTEELWARFPTASLMWTTQQALHLLELLDKSPSPPIPRLKYQLSAGMTRGHQ